jgi:hypothetical protein
MKVRKVIRKRMKDGGKGVRTAGGVHGVVAANVNEPPGSVNRVSSKSRVKVVQKGGRTEVHEEHETSTD